VKPLIEIGAIGLGILPIPTDMLSLSLKKLCNMIYLRPFDPLEVNRLISWVDSPELLVQFSGPGFEFPITKSSWNKHLSDMSIHPYFVVDVNSDDPIGYAEIVKVDEKVVKLCRLLIGDPELRGLGLGKLLVRELIYEALAISNPLRILMNVYCHNTAAIKCYESVGFVINESVSKVSLVDGVEWKSYQMDLVL
jgi:RimJ/RimL family protein N-acetyltransferase